VPGKIQQFGGCQRPLAVRVNLLVAQMGGHKILERQIVL
jgi:hypothetical protein